jgi:hypothetical protein
MSYTRQHYNYAERGEATQECDKEVGPKVPKTDWDAGTRSSGEEAPHREEKDRE